MYMDKDKKQFSKTKFLLVLTLTTSVFIIGIFFGSIISDKKLESINYMEQDFRTEISAIELQYLLLSEDPCNEMIDYSPLTDELYNIATRLDHMENLLGEDNKDVLHLKNYYSTLQIKHWLLMKKIKTDCNQNTTMILYFYDTKENCPDCEQQGFILTYLRKKFPEIYIYAFNINLDNAAIKTIKTLYEINTTPSVLIDGHKMEQLRTKDEILEKIIHNNTQ